MPQAFEEGGVKRLALPPPARLRRADSPRERGECVLFSPLRAAGEVCFAGGGVEWL